MSTSRNVETTAKDGDFTLADVRAFVAEMDAAGAAEITPIKAAVKFGGGLKSLKASAVRFGDSEVPREQR